MPLFPKTKQNNQKTAWKLQKNEYRLFVDDERVKLAAEKSTKRSDQSSSEQSSSNFSHEGK